VLTAGEPAGIGPDLCIQLAQQAQSCDLVVIADPTLLQQRAVELGLTITLEAADLSISPTNTPKGVIRYKAQQLAAPVRAGHLEQKNANYVLSSLQEALEGCLSKQYDALVTCPVHKGIINSAGYQFSGHTEFFADGAGVDKVVMMLATRSLRVALATTHLPLKDVSNAITQSSLRQVITVLHKSLQTQFGIAKPRIAVCGLNPHAGEDGHLGREEIDVIKPVLEELKRQDIAVSGPWPADTIFVKDKLQDFDVVLAMFHDQGLPVLKHSGFSKSVNVTLGLPFIRTSVDHGTALDLAGTGKANVGSLKAALDMAVQTLLRRT
jgi:4-hydroxythreonine-4-phosphate dehydrogenase